MHQRLIGSPKLWDRGGALTSTLHWFETELLTREENLVGLMAVNREGYARAYRRFPFSKRQEFIDLEEQARDQRKVLEEPELTPS